MSFKEGLTQYIEEKYEKLHKVCYYITKDEVKADDLLHTTLTMLLEREYKEEDMKRFKGNYYSYIFVALKFQYFSKNSQYHYIFRKDFADEEEPIDRPEIDIERTDEFVEEVIKMVENSNLHWYNKRVWMLYYFNEYKLDPQKMDGLHKEQMDRMRKISYRDLQADTNISYVSLCKTINKTNDYLLNKIKDLYERNF